MRILLIEDEADLAEAAAAHLKAEGHAVDLAHRLSEAQDALAVAEYRLILLDLRLPDGSGLELLRALRRRNDPTAVVILTARDRLGDRIEGLNAGADDYLVKPYHLAELSARIAAVARRRLGSGSPVARFGRLEIDGAARIARIDGVLLNLTRREWALLAALAERPGAIVSKARLESVLAGFEDEASDNMIEAAVSRLRKKIGAGAVATHRGVGYRLEAV